MPALAALAAVLVPGLVPAALALQAALGLGACLPAAEPPGSGAGAPAWLPPVGPPTTLLRAFAPPPAAAPWLPGHRGVDLAVTAGGPVRADGPGVVVFAAGVAGVPVVVVDHGRGLRSTFEPVVAALRVGTRVRAGELLGRLGVWWLLPVPGGTAGLDGHCGGQPCLHWGMVRAGSYVDPLAVTEVRPGCRIVRLLPVDPRAAVAPDPVEAAAGGPGAPERAAARASPVAATGAPGGGPGPGAAAVVAEASAMVAGAAVPTLLAVRRRRRATRAGAGPP
jgi:murein DD-endopeptidase MepM/ murein hydrolase activator NlpD